MQKINNIVANYFEVDIETLCGQQDRTEINEARDILIYFLKKRTELTIPAIANIVNRKKRAVHYALWRVRDRIDVYPKTKEQIREIDMELRKAMVVAVVESC